MYMLAPTHTMRLGANFLKGHKHMEKEKLKILEEEKQTPEEEKQTPEDVEFKTTEEQEKEDVQTLINDVKAQYEEKFLQQHDTYEKRLQERNAVIKQLLAGDNKEEEKDVIQIQIEAINERRTLQNKKW